MFSKEYPKTVVLRKGLIAVAITIMMLIVTLIIFNLYRSRNTEVIKKNNTTDSNIPSTANINDTAWFQNKNITNQQNKTREDNSPGSLENKNDDPVQNEAQNFSSQEEKPESGIQQLTNTTEDNQSQSTSTSQTSLEVNNVDDQNLQSEKRKFMNEVKISDNDYLSSTLNNPLSPYEVKAGTQISGILISGINSDLPGQIIAQVRQSVYDSVSGRYILIPQGSRLIGVYDSRIVYGQQRVLVAWSRIIFPNGQSIDLQGMPGVDISGYSGFKDVVNDHYGKLFSSVLLMSILSAGAQLSQPQQSTSNPFQAPSVGQTLAQNLGTNISETATLLTQKNLSIQPTLIIRPGYLFNIEITKDMIFPRAYTDETNYLMN